MYSSFYGFEQSPFNVTPDSEFVYYSEQHKEALAHMLYGVQERKGFIVVTGRVGSGKTTLCRAFMNELEEDTSTALVLNSKMTAREILEAILDDFGLEVPGDNPTTKDIIDKLNQFVLDEYNEGRNVCVIIDESQNLSPEALENLRLLSNLETEKEKLLQMVLVGQPELNTLLNKKELRQLKQRIAVRAYLSNLTEEETREYVNHRLELAEPRRPIEIRDEVFERLQELSGGNPRAINLIMDRTLLAAYVDDTFVIKREHIDRAIEELSEEVLEQEGKDAKVLHRIRSDGDELTIPVPAWIGNYLDDLSTHWMYGAAAGLITMVVVLGAVWIGQSGAGSNEQPPVISDKLADRAEVIPDTATQTADSPTVDSMAQTDTPPADSSDESESLALNDTSTETAPRTADSLTQADTPAQTDTEPTEGEQPVQSEQQGETGVEQDQTNILRTAINNNPPVEELPNPLEVTPVETPQQNLDYGVHSLTRYISLKLQNPSNVPGDLPSPPLSEINAELTLDQLVPDSLPGTFVRIPTQSGLPQTYGFPGFLEWQGEDGRTRTALLLPYQAQLWDPLTGWTKATERNINDHWTGNGRFLLHSAIDPGEMYRRGDVNQAVTEIQRLLNETIDAGLPLVGRYGPRTETNIREFQRSQNLRVDGIAGPSTTLALLREAQYVNDWTSDEYANYIRRVEASVVLD